MSADAWVRVLYRRNKVYTRVDPSGRPEADETGHAVIRYRPDDEREYTVRAADLAPLTDAALAELEAERDRRAREKEAARRARVPIHVFTAIAPVPGGRAAGVGVVLEADGFRREMARRLEAPAPEIVGVRAALGRVKYPSRPLRVAVEAAHTLKIIEGQWEAGVNATLVDEVRGLLARFDDWRLAKAKGTESGAVLARRLAAEARDAEPIDRLVAIEAD